MIFGIAVLSGLGGKTLAWFAATSLIAVLIGIAIGVIGNVGTGVSVTPSDAAVERLAQRSPGDWWSFLSSIVPERTSSPRSVRVRCSRWCSWRC